MKIRSLMAIAHGVFTMPTQEIRVRVQVEESAQ